MAYYYIKSGFGTRTAGGGFATKQTGDFATLGAANVYASLGTALADTTPPVAGDFLLFSHLHLATTAAYLTANVPSGVTLISVSDTAIDTELAGATEETTGANGIDINGSCSTRSMTFKAGTSGNASIRFAMLQGNIQRHVNSTFLINVAGSGSFFVIGTAAQQNPSAVTFENVNLKFGNNAQRVQVYSSRFRWHGGGLAAGSTAPTDLFQFASPNEGADVEVSGLDLSLLATTSNLIQSNISQVGRCVVSTSRLPASWTGGLVGGTPPVGFRAEMYNCDNAATTYRMWIEDPFGTIREETTNYLTAGETDGVTKVAWKITTNANATRATGGLVSPLRAIDYDSTGAKTPTFEVLTDGQLTHADLAMEVEYLGNASYPISSLASTRAAPLAADANLTAGAGTAAWNSTAGLTTPTSSKIVPSFTTALKGTALARFVLTKPSTTVYINPGPT